MIESQLIVGAKLRIGTTWENEPIYDVIEKTTNKLIYLKNDYGSSTKKAKAIDNLLFDMYNLTPQERKTIDYIVYK